MATARLPLRNRAGEILEYALIDAEDLPLVGNLRWRRVQVGRNTYVTTSINRRTTYLHRFLLRPPPEMQVDHINRNGLDNRRCNLRLATNQTNRQNMRIYARRKTSPYRGVSWDAARNCWFTRATMAGKGYFLGRFESEEEAAQVVREWRLANMPFATD